jgi:hypothetical protein
MGLMAGEGRLLEEKSEDHQDKNLTSAPFELLKEEEREEDSSRRRRPDYSPQQSRGYGMLWVRINNNNAIPCSERT